MNDVLRILEEDALASPESIAGRLGRSVEEVRAQIKQLEQDKVILAYKAIVDDDKAGRDVVQAVIEVKITPERDGGFDRLASRIAKYDQVRDCYLMSGGYDLMVVVEGSNLRQVASFVSEKLASIDGVLSTATHFMLKTYKEQGTLFEQEAFSERLKVSP
ncbi:MAG: Lrp/AsnC family transcriptional regulator [Candidatus Methylacidiphilales bacterium]